MKLVRPALFLIDGSALAYRSHFAFIRGPLVTSYGLNVSALYGFSQALLRLLKEAEPDYISVVQDPRGPTFRHELFPDYKATRQKMPAEMAEQLRFLDDLIDAFGVRRVEVQGFEADDVMGTLALRAEAAGIQTYIVSGDKDMAQLVTDKTFIYNIARAGQPVELLDPAGVEEKFKIPPSRIVDFLALQGDKSDNIPGLPGVGKVTALKLLDRFPTLEKMVEARDSIRFKKAREALQKDPEILFLSKNLARIRTDVPVPVEIEELRRGEPHRSRLREMFQRFEFRVLLEEFTEDTGSDEHDYRIVGDLGELGDLCRRFGEAEILVVDTETTSLNPLQARLVGVSLSDESRRAWYVPLPGLGESEEDLARLDLLRPLLEDDKVKKCGQNLKYDLLVFQNHGIELRGIAFDTMIGSFLLEPGTRRHNLDALALKYLRFKKIPTSELLGKKGKGQLCMEQIEVERVAEYACEDADITYRLMEFFQPKIQELELGDLMGQIELPLIPVLAGMERTGICLDTELLGDLSRSLRSRTDELRTEVLSACGGEAFNLDSPKQLGLVLFERLEIQKDLGKRKPRKTKTGSYSTDARTLEKYAEHPIIDKILEYRKLQKLIGTYVDALPKLVDPRTGRVHTSYNQTAAITGRLSSTNPNLQNIPIRTELGREIRKAFVSRAPDWVLLSADYSQIELRIMAHLSEDANLVAAFESGQDVHSRTAQLLFSVEAGEVTREMRARAKTINFGILYGMNEYGLASRLKIAVAEARLFIKSYFEKLPGVEAYIERTVEQARARGYVKTLSGRRRELPEIRSSNGRVRQAAENMAVNTPIQGSAADLIKKAMIELHRCLPGVAPSARMLLQVHDELVFEVHENELKAASAGIRAKMQNAMELQVPLVVDIGWGRNWLEAH